MLSCDTPPPVTVVLDPGDELVEAADEKQLSKTIARYGRVDLLCIDGLGSMELDRRGAELLFQVLTEREEKNSVAIASNESSNGAIIQTGPDRHRVLPTRPPPRHGRSTLRSADPAGNRTGP